MPKEDVEEYLEAIFDIGGKEGTVKTTDIAKRLNKAPASVTESFQRMSNKGLVRYKSHSGVSLTAKGFRIVTNLKRKHRLIEVFLNKVLHIDCVRVHEQACRMEHSVSDDVENALCKILRGPQRCPHGTLIPPCSLDVESCQECLSKKLDISDTQRRRMGIISLTELSPGKNGKIRFIRGGEKVVQRLSDLGLTPGTFVSIVRSAPLRGPIEVYVRGSDIIIDRGIAERIFIQV